MKTYIAQLASGFEIVICASSWKQAETLADRNARGNDKVTSVRLKK